MALRKKIREVMVPVSEYATTREDRPLKEAVLALRQVYREAAKGECIEAGHRTCLVFDNDSNLVGILDIQSILKTLIPEIAGSMSEKLTSLEVSVALAEGNRQDIHEITGNLMQRVKAHAGTRVRDMMLKVRGTGLRADAFLIEGLKSMHRLKVTVMPVYEGDTLVGVLRDSDLFLAVANIIDQ